MSAVAFISANRLGAIPVGWLVKPIGELAVIATGNTPPTADASNYGDDFLFASPADIDDSKWIHQTGKRLSRKGFSEARPFPAKSVLFVCIGSTIGKCAIASVELTSNQQINAVFPSEHLDSEFLYYSLLMAAPSVKEQAGEQAVPIVNKTQFSGTLIAVPKLPEQRAIATALSDVDALIAGLEKLIAKKRNLKQAAMQQLLTGQTRLPGFSGEWETYSVEELEKQKLVKLSRGIVISKKDIASRAGDFPIYSSSIHNDGLFGRYGDFMFEEELITWSVDGGGNFFHRPKHKFSVTNVCGYMRVDTSRICYRYFAAHLQHLHSNKSFDYLSKAHPSVVRKEYQVQLPSLEEQNAISEVLTEVDADLRDLEQRRNKTAALKQGMMQELLTGRTRLV